MDNSFLVFNNLAHLVENKVSLDLQKVIVPLQHLILSAPLLLLSHEQLSLLLLFAASCFFLPRKLRSTSIYGLAEHLSQNNKHFSCLGVDLVLGHALEQGPDVIEDLKDGLGLLLLIIDLLRHRAFAYLHDVDQLFVLLLVQLYFLQEVPLPFVDVTRPQRRQVVDRVVPLTLVRGVGGDELRSPNDVGACLLRLVYDHRRTNRLRVRGSA